MINQRDAAETPPPDAHGLPDHDCWVYRAKAPANFRGTPPVAEVITVSSGSRIDLRFDAVARGVVLEDQGAKILSVSKPRSRGMGWECELRFVRARPEVIGEWLHTTKGADLVDLHSWRPSEGLSSTPPSPIASTEPAPEDAPRAFRELTREDFDALTYAVTVALSVALSGSWAEEAARNFVQGLADGCVRKVFAFALDVLNSPTRRHARKGGPGLARFAAARAVVAYVDHVSKPKSEIERWSILLATEVPVSLLAHAELRSTLVVEERCA